MSNNLKTDIVLNLKGDLARKAQVYGKEMTMLGSRSKAAFTMIGTSAVAASRGIDTFGNRMMFVAGATAVAFERTFVKTAAEFERYQTMLNKLQGSPEEGAKAMKWIEDFTQNTPYAIDEVTQAFVRLKAFGIDPMDGSMQAIADQAAMMGGTSEAVEGIATALGQAWTKGKLQAEEAMQLLERGVPVWDYLVKASKDLGMNNGEGFTKEQLTKMSENGQLGRSAITALMKQMGKESEGAAKDQMNTWNGMISNMGDHWKLFQKDVMESGAFSMLKDQLGEFLDMLDEMKETGEYDEFVEKVGHDLVEAFKSAASAARDIKDVGEELWPVIRQIGSMASSLAETVGGFGNLAKILASVYAINKMIRIGSPLLKGGAALGGMVFSGKKGKPSVESLNALGATPVFVVNMPGGGFNGPDIDIPDKKNPKKSLLSMSNLAQIPLIGWASAELADITDDMLASQFDGYRDYDAKFTTKIKAFFGDKEAQAQDVKYYGADPAKYEAKPMTPPNFMLGGYGTPTNSYLGQQIGTQNNYGQQPQVPGEMKLKVEVSDERVKVTPTYVPPGITVDPDLGIN
ncbi:phage tail tape measure protein [Vibrio cholerae]|nr:phage tail tape measure protein [Vibrio cholerae]